MEKANAPDDFDDVDVADADDGPDSKVDIGDFLNNNTNFMNKGDQAGQLQAETQAKAQPQAQVAGGATVIE